MKNKRQHPERKKEIQLSAIYNKSKKGITIDEREYIAFSNLAFLRKNISPSEGVHLIRNFCSSPHFRDLINNRFVKHDYNICSTIKLTENESYSINDFLSWYIEIIQHYSDKLSKYCSQRDLFYKLLLLGKKNEAIGTVDDIEREFGKTHWSVSARLSVFYFSGDMQSITEFDETFNKLENELSKTFLLYTTTKANVLVSPERYIYSIGKMIEEIRLAEPNSKKIENSIKFRHDFDPSYKYEEIEHLLNFDVDLRLIDLYNNFIRFTTYLYIHGHDFTGISKAILGLSVNDNVLGNLIKRITLSPELSMHDIEFNDVIKEFLNGNNEETIKKCESILSQKPYYSVYYEIYAKALINTKKDKCSLDGNIKEIIDQIISVFNANGGLVNLKKLHKTFHAVSYSYWSYSLKAFIDRYSYKSSAVIWHAYDFNDATQVRFNELSMKDITQEPELSNIDISSLPELRQLKLNADISFYQKKYDESLMLYNSIIEKNEASELKKKTIFRKCECLLLDNREDECIEILAGLLEAGKNISCFPISNISNYIANSSQYSNNIEKLKNRSTILSFYNKEIEAKYTQNISDFVENIFEILKFNSTKDILDNASTLTHKFILEVLTIDVLEGMVSIFNSKKDVIATRVLLLRNLVERHDKKSIEYKEAHNEYNLAHQKLIAEYCSRQTGNGRISVDKEQLKSTLIPKLDNEIFQLKCLDDRDIKRKQIKDVSDYEYSSYHDEFHSRLIQLTLIVVEEYSINKLYGIDQSLNVGIRHGGMLNLLWAPIRKYNLATNKISNGKFVVDVDWLKNFKITYNYYKDKIINEVVSNILNFNRDISNTFLKFKSRIHVNTGEFIDDDKLFNYFLTLEFIEVIGDKIDEINTEQFIDTIFNYLDARTDAIILKEKSIFIESLRDDVSHCFKNLKSELENNHIEELTRSMHRSKDDIMSKIDDFSSWLDWQRSPNIPVKLGIALEKAIQICKELHPQTNFIVNISDNSTYIFEGRFFQKFVSIFQLIIDNACIHSKGSHGDLNIEFEIREHSTQFDISAKNNTIFSCEDIDRIDKISKSILSQDFIEGASREINSGLFKIKKILSHDLLLDNNFSITALNGTFSIQFSFKI